MTLPLHLTTVIAVFGGPGSGKGTQGKFIRDSVGAGFLEMGSFFRDVVNGKAQDLFSLFIGRSVDLGRMQKGFYLPDEPVNEVFRQQLYALPYSPVLVIDGAGRTANQVEYMVAQLKRLGVKSRNMLALMIDADMEECRKRLLARATSSGRVDDSDQAVINTRVDEYLLHRHPVRLAIKKNMELVEVLTTVPDDNSKEAVSRAIAEMNERVVQALALHGFILRSAKEESVG